MTKELWELQEEWAEREAKFCDTMVYEFLDNARKYLAAPLNEYTTTCLENALRCNAQAMAWKMMANNLRQPRRIRMERDNQQ
jgi:hypothetical protein